MKTNSNTSTETRNKARYPLSALLFRVVPEVLARVIKQLRK